MLELAEGLRAVIDELGETPLEAIEEHLRLEPQPPPDPAQLEAGDAIVAVDSAAVGWVDLLMTSGQYQHQPTLPYCPGLEYAGEVVWVGDEVSPAQLKVGDAVISDGLLTGPRSLGAHQRYGGFASYTVAPATALRPLPTGFSFAEGCSFLGSYETAYHCLIARGRLQAGEWVLINGASGATGLAAVHLAKLVGARVIATGRSPGKLDVVAAEGADHTICSAVAGEPGLAPFRDQVKALTGGHGVDLVYDGVGGAISLESLRCTRFGARYLIVGWAATPFVARGKGRRGAPNANQLPTNLILIKGLEVLGCPTAIATHREPSIRDERLRALMRWVDAGEIKPHVSAHYPLARVADAMRAKWRSEVVGGCVLHPPGRGD